MIFDDRISENVSLSHVLDTFIEENEKPGIIISFLSSYSLGEVVDILENSLYHVRLFQLDFIASCSQSEQMKFYSLIKDIGNVIHSSEIENCISTMVFQIMTSNISNIVKNQYRHYLKQYSYSHPYKGLNGSIANSFDCIFKDCNIPITESFDRISRLSDDDFSSYMKVIENSLWFNRMFQMDFFETLSVEKKIIFLHSAFLRSNPYRIYSQHAVNSNPKREIFLKQLFVSENVEVEVKMEFLHNVWDSDSDYIVSVCDKVKDLVNESSSYAELMMMLNIYGIDEYSKDLIYMLLCEKRLKYLKEMYENDRDMIENNFDICDILETLLIFLKTL